MKHQRSSIGSTSSQTLGRTAHSPEHILLGHKSKKDSSVRPALSITSLNDPILSHKFSTGHVIRKVSQQLNKEKIGEVYRSPEMGGDKGKNKPEYVRGHALEVLLEEDLRSAQSLGLGVEGEMAAVRRVFQAVMDRNREFKGVLGKIREHYEDLIQKSANEASSAHQRLQKHHEDKKQLLKRLNALAFETAQLKLQLDSSAKDHLKRKTCHTGPTSPKGPTSPPVCFESTERMSPWGKTTGKHRAKESCSSPSDYSELEPMVRGPPKALIKPSNVPRLPLELLSKNIDLGISPKVKREAIYIEDM